MAPSTGTVRCSLSLLLLLTLGCASGFQNNVWSNSASNRVRMQAVKQDVPDEVDVLVIGSGLSGLSCASLLAFCGRKTLVLESHDTPGGAAHTWERRGFHFESGNL